SLASLSYFYHRRSYDHRRETDLDFAPIEGTHLLFQQHEVEGQIKLNLDEARHWRTRFRAAWGSNEDNGPGFYDYNKLRFAARLAYHAKTWNFSLEGKALNYNYVSQPLTDGTGI